MGLIPRRTCNNFCKPCAHTEDKRHVRHQGKDSDGVRLRQVERELSPTGSCLSTWFPAGGAVVEGWEPSGGGASLEVVGCWGQVLEFAAQPSFLSLLHFLICRDVESQLTQAPAMKSSAPHFPGHDGLCLLKPKPESALHSFVASVIRMTDTWGYAHR